MTPDLPPPPALEPVDTYQARLQAWYEVCDAILRASEKQCEFLT